jgi:hypothetical protein
MQSPKNLQNSTIQKYSHTYSESDAEVDFSLTANNSEDEEK